MGPPLQVSPRTLANPHLPPSSVAPGAQHPQCFVLRPRSPRHPPSCRAASLAADFPGSRCQAVSSFRRPEAARGSQRQRRQQPWRTPASGRSPCGLRHRCQARRMGTQPQAHSFRSQGRVRAGESSPPHYKSGHRGWGSTRPPLKLSKLVKSTHQGFPGGAVVKNPPANAGDMGSSPGRGRSHMPQSN